MSASGGSIWHFFISFTTVSLQKANDNWNYERIIILPLSTFTRAKPWNYDDFLCQMKWLKNNKLRFGIIKGSVYPSSHQQISKVDENWQNSMEFVGNQWKSMQSSHKDACLAYLGLFHGGDNFRHIKKAIVKLLRSQLDLLD